MRAIWKNSSASAERTVPRGQKSIIGLIFVVVAVVVAAGQPGIVPILLVITAPLGWDVLIRIQIELEEGLFLALLLPACLAAAVNDLLHQLVHPGNILIVGTIQGHLGQAGRKGAQRKSHYMLSLSI